MRASEALIVTGAIVGLLPSVSTLAGAQSREGLSIADNDSIYLDGRSFKIIPGHANGDASALIRRSGARELGPAAIVFRKGDTLYLATVPPNPSYAGDGRRDYARDYDRGDYGRDYDRGDYATDNRRDSASSQPRPLDPDNAQYRLRKFFDENWTTGDSR
jgi:hypothetical protein